MGGAGGWGSVTRTVHATLARVAYHRPMPLLLIPFLLIGGVLLFALLLPFSLIQRYRMGRARRRAIPWVVGLNA